MSLRPARTLPAVSAFALLAGCGSATTAQSAAGPGPGASSPGYPTRDVVSGIAEDGELPAAQLAKAVNRLISDGGYAKIPAKGDVDGSGVPTSQVNPPANL